jgi:hypothetical protein
VAIPDSDAFKLTTSLSVEGWVRLESVGPGIIFIRADNRGGLDPYFMTLNEDGRLHWGISDANNISAGVETPDPLPTGEWLHIAGVLDDTMGRMDLYINGTAVGHTTTSIRPFRDLDPAWEPGVGIGNHGGTLHNFPFDGLIDEWALYSRALSASEIRAVYQARAAGKCSLTTPPQPVATYDVSQDFSPILNPIGSWSYGYLASLGGTFVPLTFNKTFSADNGATIAAWQVSDSLAPSVNRVLGDQVAISEGGAFTAQPGTIYVWPGNPGSPGNFGVMRFTVPDGGDGVYDLHTSARSTFDGPTSGDTDYHVLRNGQPLLDRFLFPNSVTTYSNLLTLAAGDTIDFVVGRGEDDVVDHSSLKVEATLFKLKVLPPSTGCVPSPAGLVAWWRGEGNTSDALGRHPGTIVGNVTFAPGMVGQGFQFDGSGGYVRIPNDDALDFPSELTVEFWYRHDGAPGESYGLVTTRGTETGPVNFGISVIPIGIGPYFNDPGVATGDDANAGGTFEASRHEPAPSSGEFHHLATTFRQTPDNQVELKTYIDGRWVRTKRLAAQLSAAINDSAIVIGRSAEYGEEIFHGVIDEVSIYRRALTTNEIRMIAAARSAGKCPVNGAPPGIPLLGLLMSSPVIAASEPLRSRLETVASSLVRGNARASLRQLQSFQSDVERLLDPAAEQPVLQLSQQLIEALDPQGWIRTELTALLEAPPRVLRLTRSGDEVRIESCAPPGSSSRCRLEQSDNLRDWTPAGGVVEISDGFYQGIHVSSAHTMRFYRLVMDRDE